LVVLLINIWNIYIGMICTLSEHVCNHLIEKYSFLKSIKVNCTEKNNSHIYMEPTITIETTPLAESFYDLKYDVYRMVKEETNKTPQLIKGWTILSEGSKNARSSY
jgi:hypothetical protein